MAPLTVVFLGTPDFAVPTLRAVHAAGHRVVCAYTQPARPAGRGHSLRPSPVEFAAHQLGIPVRTPVNLKDPADQQQFAGLGADIGVVVAYGLILPPPVLAAPRLGCVNLHASLLPRWRGAAPIARAVMAGDTEFGITVMQMDAGLDTGPMLLAAGAKVSPRPTAGEVHDALAELGAKLMVDALAQLAAGTLLPVPQPELGATYAKKITNAETHIDWHQSAAEVDRMVRGLTPFPGAFGEANGSRIRVLEAEQVAGSGTPGIVLDEHLTVACGTGALRLVRVQREGKKPMTAAELLRGFALPPGTIIH